MSCPPRVPSVTTPPSLLITSVFVVPLELGKQTLSCWDVNGFSGRTSAQHLRRLINALRLHAIDLKTLSTHFYINLPQVLFSKTMPYINTKLLLPYLTAALTCPRDTSQ